MNQNAHSTGSAFLSKVPQITNAFWIAKILATTTAGTTLSDYLTRAAGLGYLWQS